MKIVYFISHPLPIGDRNPSDFFSGVLDLPLVGVPSSGDKVIVAGWIMLKGDASSYLLNVHGDDNFSMELSPNTPRPDVANKLGATPFAGDTVFKGFHAEVPFSKRLRIYVKIGGEQIFWKDLEANEVELDLQQILRRQLVGRSIVTINEEAEAEWSRSGPEIKRSCVDFEHSSVVLLDEAGVERCSKIEPDERQYFFDFMHFVSSAGFFAHLLKRNYANEAVKIPAPFFDAQARLVGSFFNGINFLIFEVGGVRFYIGQYIHTVDFVYFPDRALCFRPANSLYDHQHLKKLISAVVDCPSAFEHALRGNGVVEAVLINGVSPYHFFYDCIPSLYIARKSSNFLGGLRFYSLNGACFFPLDVFFGEAAKIENNAVTTSEWNAISGNSAPLTVLAGTSYRTLAPEELDELDAFIVERAEIAAKGRKVADVLGGLSGRFPVLWLGISAQKRAWLNQEDALLSVVERLSSRYPKLAIVFDGMTSNIYGEPVNDAQFSADREIVARLTSALPKGIPGFDLVGMSSAEKIRICQVVHFFVANYGTGSIYPARFLRLPGVAHWSHGLFDVAKDAHIHHDTNVMPFDHVTDFPDPDCPRLDFISYHLDEQIFVSLVERDFVKKID